MRRGFCLLLTGLLTFCASAAHGAEAAAETSGQKLAPAAEPTPVAAEPAPVAAEPAPVAAEPAPVAARDTEYLEVFASDFGELSDKNYDGWPDDWTRRGGPGFPQYVNTQIIADSTVKSGQCLSLQLEGASASISSPAILARQRFSYQLTLQLKMLRMQHSTVTVRMDFKNSAGEVLQTEQAAVVSRTEEDWTKLTIGPQKPYSSEVDRVVVTIEALRQSRGDIHGELRVADVWLARQPSMRLSTANRFNVFTNPRDVQVTCSLSGINEQHPIIKFQLLDAAQELVGEEGVKKPPVKLLVEKAVDSSDIVYGIEAHRIGYEGHTKWRPPIKENGFYQVVAQMISPATGEVIDTRTCTVAVVAESMGETQVGEFGWTLPDPHDNRLYDGQMLEVLQDLLPLAGVSWVKVPAWFTVEDTTHADELVSFADRLGAKNIETIGIMLDPSAKPERGAHIGETWPIAAVFTGDASNWLAKFDHVMARLSLRIRWWQLGDDFDTSFVGYANLTQKISDIQQRLFRFGQDVKLGLGSGWKQSVAEAGAATWDFEQISAQPALTAAGLEELLQTHKLGTRRWVLIDPNATPPVDPKHPTTASPSTHEDRVRELVLQMVTAKVHGARGIFVANPFANSKGLMTEEGGPGELLLPWRTTAQLLGGAEYLGQLQLPQRSQNAIFRRTDGKVVMAIWNHRVQREQLSLGSELTQVNVWGKSAPLSATGTEQSLTVAPTPTFIVGLNEAIVRWSMAVAFEQQNLPSVFDVEHPLTLRMKNTFGQGIGGQVSIYVPDQLKLRNSGRLVKSETWIISPGGEFRIKPHESLASPFSVKLKEAAYGEQPVRIDFQVEGDQAYKFSVWRNVTIGLGDIEIKIETSLDSKGRLVVTQKMMNAAAEPADFKCQLMTQGRKRQRMQVFELGPEGDKKTYAYSNGAALVGQEFRLKLEETSGSRVLIHRFVAEK